VEGVVATDFVVKRTLRLCHGTIVSCLSNAPVRRSRHRKFTGLTCEHVQNCRAFYLNPWWTVFSEDVWRSARKAAATGTTGQRRAYPGPR
jgi:hypothetical protein